jgi:hypothetical protein
MPNVPSGVSLGSFVVNANAILRLATPGDYYFENLTLEPGSVVDLPLTGRVRLFIRGNLTYRGFLRSCANCTAPVVLHPLLGPFVQPAQKPNPDNTLVVVLGSGTVQLQRQLNFHVLAPDAQVNMDPGSGCCHQGSIFAKSFELHQYQHLVHRPLPLSLLAGLGATTPNNVRVTPAPPAGQKDTMQSETAMAVARKPNGTANLIVAYNDYGDPLYQHTPDGSSRTILEGGSLLGFSVSQDGGETFTTGRISPPAGFSIIHADPAAASDPNSTAGEVYLAMMAQTTASWDAQTGGAESLFEETPAVDGLCVAKSTDWGLTFPLVSCVPIPTGADRLDGATMVVVGDQVLVASTVFEPARGATVFQAQKDTLLFSSFEAVSAQQETADHPRLRAYGGKAYLMTVSAEFSGGQQTPGTLLVAARSLSQNGWLVPGAVQAGGTEETLTGLQIEEPDGRRLRQANQFSFDIGVVGTSTDPVLRVAYAVGGSALKFASCPVSPSGGLSECTFKSWSVASGTPQFSPVLAHGQGRWMVRWQESTPTGVTVKAAELFGTGVGTDSQVRLYTVAPAMRPCGQIQPAGDIYWGDYDDLVFLGGPSAPSHLQRFYTTFTRNGPNCTEDANFTVPMDVYGATLW